MKLIRGIKNLKNNHQGCVATIGNFDGLHLGHQKVLREPMIFGQILYTFNQN